MATAIMPYRKDWEEEINRLKSEMAMKAKQGLVNAPQAKASMPAKPLTKEQVDLETKRMLAESVPPRFLDYLKHPIPQTILGTAEYLGQAALYPFAVYGEARERAKRQGEELLGIEPIYPRGPYEPTQEIRRRMEELLPGGPTLRPATEIALGLGGYRIKPPLSPPEETGGGMAWRPPSTGQWVQKTSEGVPPNIGQTVSPVINPETFIQYQKPDGTMGFADSIEKVPLEYRATAVVRRWEDAGRGIFGGTPPSPQLPMTYPVGATTMAPPQPLTYREWFRDPTTGELRDLGERTYVPGAQRRTQEFFPEEMGPIFRRALETVMKPTEGWAYTREKGYFPVKGYTKTQRDIMGEILRSIIGGGYKMMEEGMMAPYREALTQKTIADTQRALAEIPWTGPKAYAEMMSHMRSAGMPYTIPPGYTAIMPGGERFVTEMPTEKGSVITKILEDIRKTKEADAVLGKTWTQADEMKEVRRRIWLSKSSLEKTGEWENVPLMYKKMTREEFFPIAKEFYAKGKKKMVKPEELEAIYQEYLKKEGP